MLAASYKSQSSISNFVLDVDYNDHGEAGKKGPCISWWLFRLGGRRRRVVGAEEVGWGEPNNVATMLM